MRTPGLDGGLQGTIISYARRVHLSRDRRPGRRHASRVAGGPRGAVVRRGGERRARRCSAEPGLCSRAGRDEAMEAVAALARKDGAYRCERLDVSVPSHCALLDGVATELTRAFRGIQLRRPHLTYLSSSVSRPLFDGGRVADDLACNVA